ncbi:hypothetical protein BGZ46_006694 [Entomortierella lignicola]|nr:hypothetical protein BGZ46_006694 [Entomortierella lignicola]
MSNLASDGMLQVFRPVYKDDVSGTIIPFSKINIKPRRNYMTGDYIILWDDVKAALKKPLHVWCGDTSVPFHVDDNFVFLQPLRFSAQTGVVLDVVVAQPEIETGMYSLPVSTPISTLFSLGSNQSSIEVGRPATNTSSNMYNIPTTNSAHRSTYDYNQTHQPMRAPEDRGEAWRYSVSNEVQLISRAPQIISEFDSDIRDSYDHTQSR